MGRNKKKKEVIVKTLNKEHAEVLKEYMTMIDASIYHSTEGMNSYRFECFKDCKNKGIAMSNEMGEQYIDEGAAEDWIVTLPNFLIFSVLGFLSGIRTEENEDELDQITEDLYNFHIKSIKTLTDIGSKFEYDTPRENIFKIRTRTKK